LQAPPAPSGDDVEPLDSGDPALLCSVSLCALDEVAAARRHPNDNDNDAEEDKYKDNIFPIVSNIARCKMNDTM
jgi:hypothetical protein